MALIPMQSSLFTNKPHFLLSRTLPTKFKFTITSLNSSSQSSKPTINNDPNDQTSNNPDPKPISSTGLGFGSTQQPKQPSSTTTTGKKKGRREKAIIRRTPVEKPSFLDKKSGLKEEDDDNQQQGLNESAFLLSWLGLGVVILVEGIVLASSGFLPEEWDKFLVKFLYPSFTPTVVLFVAGTVVYGVFKYLQNESAGNQK